MSEYFHWVNWCSEPSFQASAAACGSSRSPNCERRVRVTEVRLPSNQHPSYSLSSTLQVGICRPPFVLVSIWTFLSVGVLLIHGSSSNSLWTKSQRPARSKALYPSIPNSMVMEGYDCTDCSLIQLPSSMYRGKGYI